MAFVTLSMAEVFHSFNMRSLKGSIFKMKYQNKWLWGAGIISAFLTTILVTVKPIAKVFSLEQLDIGVYSLSLVVAFCIIPLVEIVKLITRCIDKKKSK
jgi:Ca2+-transporting ATPase